MNRRSVIGGGDCCFGVGDVSCGIVCYASTRIVIECSSVGNIGVIDDRVTVVIYGSTDVIHTSTSVVCDGSIDGDGSIVCHGSIVYN